MGTSEEVRSEQQQRQHHAFRSPPLSAMQQPQQAGQAYAPGSPQSAQWPLEKLSESEVAHTQSMDVDPSYDATNQNEPMSPSPTHYGHPHGNASPSVFHFGEPQQLQQHYVTPLTRFLTKQTFGFLPKPSFPSPTDGVPPRSAPSSPLPGHTSSGNSKVPSLRLPSRSGGGSASQSPLSSPHSTFSLPVGETLSQLFGSASLGSNSLPGSPAPSSPSNPPRSSTFTLPPLKRACLSPTTPLPSLSQLEDFCQPFRYQRSMSCPSDAMARPAMEEFAENEAHAAQHVVLQHLDVPKYRVERSNSVDVSAVLAAREAHARALHGDGASYSSPSHAHTTSHSSHVDFHGWLDRPHSDHLPLASLAESAHSMQRLEQSRTNMDSPRSITSGSGSGDESAKPFDVSDSNDLRREKKLCAFPRCSSNAVTRGLCISHGGGRRCQRKGCTRGAQSKGLCVAHGGGRICKAKGCSNIQRSMGLCIRHGGGKRCSVPGCQKGVVRQDLCTAHGGKRKCKIEDCNKHVKKKGLCRSHANSVLGASAMSSPQEAMSPEYSS